MTAGELITAQLRLRLNQGSPTVASQPGLRERARFNLNQVCKRVWNASPPYYRFGNTTVVLTAGVGTLPSDFFHMGTKGQVWVQGQNYRHVNYVPLDAYNTLLQTRPQTGIPYVYTLIGKTALGIPQIGTYPQDNSTLIITGYARNTPDIIDYPQAPILSAGAAGLPNGTYTGRVTFVHPTGETEGGTVSPSLTVVSLQILWTGIEVSPNRTVTSRRLYRPTVALPAQYKLVATIADNVTTTFTDNVSDATLAAAAAIPTVLTAVSGLEIFPPEFHEAAILDGLDYLMKHSQGDNRDLQMESTWEKHMKRLWEEVQEGQNVVQAFPDWGDAMRGGGGGHPVWSHWTPPS